MAKKTLGRFGGLIDQMNKDKHKLVLVTFDKEKDFAHECIRRGYDMEVGDATDTGVVMYRKK